MLFNSFWFLVFFPIVIGLYFAIPRKYRWMLLLGSSYYFYMSWKLEYVVLIMASTLVDYIAGIQIHKTDNKQRKKFFLIFSLVVNLGLLAAFKYWNFFNDSIRAVASAVSIPWQGTTLDLLLPIGISFYTFQTISYTIDVYRGKQTPERHLGFFALYVSFWPQLVAGPIERAGHLLPQLKAQHSFNADRFVGGMRLIGWGFFKKVVIADRIALFVNPIYNNPGNQDPSTLILATILFGVQVFCDFSGYTDIARGSARIMGVDLRENFKQPFFARSVADFWNRWHITLYTWFRDYIYIPLGGSNVAKWKWARNVLIVFFISGLWHGAAWTFVIWGLSHALFIILTRYSAKPREALARFIGLTDSPPVYTAVKIFVTFVLINISWVFFRANSMSDAITILTRSVMVIEKINPLLISEAIFLISPLIILALVPSILHTFNVENIPIKRIRIFRILISSVFALFLLSYSWLNLNALEGYRYYHWVLILFIPLFLLFVLALIKKDQYIKQYFSLNPFLGISTTIAIIIMIFALNKIVFEWALTPVLLLPIAILLFGELARERWGVVETIHIKNILFRWYVYLFIVLYIAVFGVFQAVNFIYFQF